MRKLFTFALLTGLLAGMAGAQGVSPGKSKLREKSAALPEALRGVATVRGPQGLPPAAKLGVVSHFSQQASLKAIDPEARGAFEANGTPSFLWGKNLFAVLNAPAPEDPAPGYSRRDGVDGLTPSPLVRHTLDGLQSLAAVLKMQNPADEWRFKTVETDEAGRRHVRMTQQKDGIPVYGSDLVVHYDAHGHCYAINGRFEPTSRVTPADFTADVEVCAQNALAHLAERAVMRLLDDEQRRLLNYHGPIARRVVYPFEGRHLPAFHITLRPNFIERWEYFVDAQTGRVLDFYYHVCTNGPVTATAQNLHGQNVSINAYLYNGTHYLIDAAQPMFNAGASTMPQKPVGAILTLDARNTADGPIYFVTSSNNTWTDRTAVSAHENSYKCYHYYHTTHQRKAIDGNGGNIISVVHIADSDGGGLDNAFWNGELMGYGDGRDAFDPLAKALDVAGHEMTHGVISNTCNLEYRGQSGAINESLADVFGAMIDRDDWHMGEEVTRTTYFPTGRLRSLEDPNQGLNPNQNGWQPKSMSQFVEGGGVHTNSGVPNYAAYLFASTNSVGRAKAEKIYYKAMRDYLTARSQFIDLRRALVQAATDIHGPDDNIINILKSSFDQVGILDGPPTPPIPDNPVNPGSEWMLFHGLPGDQPDVAYYTYNFAVGGQPARHELTEFPLRKISVTDDGSQAYYVGSDSKKIYRIDLSTGNDQLADIPGEWDNVVVSKHGTMLALVSTAVDSSIYIYHTEKQQMRRFILYHPTFSQNQTSAGNPSYADMIDWDFDEEHLMYDGYTFLYSYAEEDTADLSYWDVGYMRVWDKEADDFGDGQVFKLFSGLEPYANIGNPAFSKNSPLVAAFDYFSSLRQENTIISVDFETGNIGEVQTQNVLGYPSYDKNDRKMAFDYYDGVKWVVAARALAEDKISGTGLVESLFSNAQWGIYFADGNRAVSRPSFDGRLSGFGVYPNPFENGFRLTFDNPQRHAAVVSVTDLAGKTVFMQRYAGAQEAEVNFSAAPGLYFLHVEANGKTARAAVVKK